MSATLSKKPPLDKLALRDVIDLSLWAGQLLLQHGAESARIEETVHRLGTGLGADWMDILVSPNAIAVTTVSGEEFRTKIRRVVSIGVNLRAIEQINSMTQRVIAGELDRVQVRREIEQIVRQPRQYTRWASVVMVGLSCAAFSQLFGGDWPVFFTTLVASMLAMFVRQELIRRHFNPLLVVIGTSFVATIFASLASRFQWGEQPQLALASSVLLLVPGVALINSAEDLITGHLVVGIIRGISGGLISLGIAIGILMGIRLMGVSGL
jgi:uncharacterized membrane protein YjjP (DUF1212 family)